MSKDLLVVQCDNCSENAPEPYIECCDCDVNLCTSCFSRGQECKAHKNDHRYAIRRNDFPLFENCNWSAKEECKLLTALSNYGYGNWEEISKSVHTRSKLECQEHYKKYYIENVQSEELDILPHTDQSMFPRQIVPFLLNTEVSRDPPRNNQSDQLLAGYNAYRSEFELSYDNNAESIFNIENNYSDDDEDDECMNDLKLSLLNALNNRLQERRRRYQIIQEHGLILVHKLMSWVQRYDKTLIRQKVERILPFMQLMTGMQFDAFLESLSLESELMLKLLRLSECRRIGIKTLYGLKVYEQMQKENENICLEQKHFTSVMSEKFSSQSPTKIYRGQFTKDGQIKKYKRSIMPLDIVDLPGYYLLSDSEKELCSNLRLVPQNFLDIKSQLIAENSKMGYLRLLDARKIVKIDVNKTRKIYDHLVSEGFIFKPI